MLGHSRNGESEFIPSDPGGFPFLNNFITSAALPVLKIPFQSRENGTRLNEVFNEEVKLLRTEHNRFHERKRTL